MKKIYMNEKFKHFLHGGDYNPDQWQNYPDVLKEDMRLMKLANCNTMTDVILAVSPAENSRTYLVFGMRKSTLFIQTKATRLSLME